MGPDQCASPYDASHAKEGNAWIEVSTVDHSLSALDNNTHALLADELNGLFSFEWQCGTSLDQIDEISLVPQTENLGQIALGNEAADESLTNYIQEWPGLESTLPAFPDQGPVQDDTLWLPHMSSPRSEIVDESNTEGPAPSLLSDASLISDVANTLGLDASQMFAISLEQDQTHTHKTGTVTRDSIQILIGWRRRHPGCAAPYDRQLAQPRKATDLSDEQICNWFHPKPRNDNCDHYRPSLWSP